MTASQSTIIFIDDLQRHQFWPAKEFFYDLLRAPIKAATGTKAGPSTRRQLQRAGFLPEANPGTPERDGPWLASYDRLTPEAVNIYAPFLHADKIYCAYEMTPGLRRLLTDRGLRYIDFRLSPLRFLPDLLIAVRTNIPELQAYLKTLSVQQTDIYEAAGRLRADFLHRHRNVPQLHESFEGAAVFIGQTEADMSLVLDGKFARVDNCLDWIAAKATGRRLIYIPHPYAPPAHAQHELQMLQTIDPACAISGVNIYDLFCLEDDCTLFGLSSGALYEAAYFDKHADIKLPPICPLYDTGQKASENDYVQITLDEFTHPDFIRAALGTPVPATPRSLRDIRPNTLRELHNAWWSYAHHVVKDRQFWAAVRQPFYATIGASLTAIISSLGERSEAEASFRAELERQIWQWMGGGPTIFKSDGTVRQGEYIQGKFAILSAATREAIVVWQGGLWIDRLTFAPDWSRIAAINHHGIPFEIFPTPTP